VRNALMLAALIALSTAGSACAEQWVKYFDGEEGFEWSYDRDYSFRDNLTGRVVVMEAISKPSAGIGPGGPGRGVGNIYALDCVKHTIIEITAYKPSAPFNIPPGWRDEAPKRGDGENNAALFAAACFNSDALPVR
jgi:hypothetical protein